MARQISSRTIRGLNNGVSQQASQLRLESQNQDQTNAYNTIREGLTKRPNTEFVAQIPLTGLGVGALPGLFKVHAINRDPSEQFFAVFTGSISDPLFIFDLAGVAQTIVYDNTPSKTYVGTNFPPTGGPTQDIRAVTVADTTIVANRHFEIGMDTTVTSPAQDDFALIWVKNGFVGSVLTHTITIDGVAFARNTNPSSRTGLIADAILADLNDPAIYSKIAAMIVGESVIRVNKWDVELSLVNATYEWNLSASGFKEYYLELSGGGDPGLLEPDVLIEDNGALDPNGVFGTLTSGQWDFGDNDGLGFDTIYVRTNGDKDPDTLALDAIESSDFDGIFTITAGDDWGDEVVKVIHNEVDTIQDLPPIAVDGMVLKVTGTTNSDEGAFYVKFEDATSKWTETVGPGLANTLDAALMPRQIIKTGPTTFTVSEISWDDRLVGDDDTVPLPSFIVPTPTLTSTTEGISDVFFWKDRLGLLYKENVLLSKAGEAFDFWPTTASEVLDDDNIDVAIQTNDVSILHAAVPFTDQLLLMATRKQFVAHSGNLALTPKTFSIDQTTNFPYEDHAIPAVAGPNAYFISELGDKASIVREYFVAPDSLVNDAADITAHVPEFLPENVKKIISAPHLGILLFILEDSSGITGTNRSSEVWCYNYFWEGDRKVQSAWNKWDFGTKRQCIGGEFFGNTLYLLFWEDPDGVPSNIRVNLEKINFDNVDTGVLSYKIHGDRLMDLNDFTASASASGLDTRLTVPEAEEDVNVAVDWILVNKTTGVTLTDITRTGAASDQEYIIVGTDLFTADLFKSFYFLKLYNFSNELSRFYPRDSNGNAVVDVKVMLKTIDTEFTDSGDFTITVTPQGRDPLVHTFDGTDTTDSTLSSPRTGHERFLIMTAADDAKIVMDSKSRFPLKIPSITLEYRGYDR